MGVSHKHALIRHCIHNSTFFEVFCALADSESGGTSYSEENTSSAHVRWIAIVMCTDASAVDDEHICHNDRARDTIYACGREVLTTRRTRASRTGQRSPSPLCAALAV